jgi:dTMP kinase
MRGFFITFEGLEGAGKSTQAELLTNRLRQEGYPVLLTREPGGTHLGEAVRSILKDHHYEEMDELAEVFLFAAARRQHVEHVLRPTLAAGAVVICDRFTDATLAYQGHGRRIPLGVLAEINRMCTADIRPDITFYLDVDPGQSWARIRERGEPLDRMERSHAGFFERVREGYLAIAREDPLRVCCLDGTLPPVVLHRRITAVVLRALQL